MGLRYSTVTGVARDDQPDGAASLYAAIGGHTAQAVPLAEILKDYGDAARRESLRGDLPWPGAPA